MFALLKYFFLDWRLESITGLRSVTDLRGFVFKNVWGGGGRRRNRTRNKRRWGRKGWGEEAEKKIGAAKVRRRR